MADFFHIAGDILLICIIITAVYLLSSAYTKHYIDIYLFFLKRLPIKNQFTIFFFHAVCEAAAYIDGFYYNLFRPGQQRFSVSMEGPCKKCECIISRKFGAGTKVEAYPAPQGALLNDTFNVYVNGIRLDVYDARVRLHTECHIGFAYFDFSGSIEVMIVSNKTFINKVMIRPLSSGIIPSIQENIISFTLCEPRNLSIEVNDSLEEFNLLLFANPLETCRPKPGDRNVIYFGPGIHDIGGGDYPGEAGLRIASGQTVYIAGGAIVRGAIKSCGAGNIKILGRGILDGYLIVHELVVKRTKLLELRFGRNLHIEGIILKDSPHCAFFFGKFKNVVIRYAKNISYYYNADGSNPVASQNVLIENCFIRTEDDAIAVKAAFFGCRGNVSDIAIRNTVLWNEDAGNGLEVGYENSAGYMRNISFKNVDLIHCRCGNALSIHHADKSHLSNVLFENVTVEDTTPSSSNCLCTKMVYIAIQDSKYSMDNKRGRLNNVTFRNVSWSGDIPSIIKGYDSKRMVRGVNFENCTRNGKLITCAEDANLEIGDYVADVSFSVRN